MNRILPRIVSVLLSCVMFWVSGVSVASAQESDLPRFTVPDHDSQSDAINELHALHHGAAFSDCTLWDPWLPHATLWTGQKPRERYRQSFLNRKIDAEGYVSVNQHRGMGHSEGWPFPAWQQSAGAGFHFSIADEVMAIQQFAQQAITNTDGWEIHGSHINLKSLITAIDTRHPITNANFIRGSAEYFAWTRDVEFLRKNMSRMRRAMQFALSEFQIRQKKRVHVPWVGHDGRSGLVAGPNGIPQPRLGLGVGNNYYDLVPFGGDDALATIYYFFGSPTREGAAICATHHLFIATNSA